MVKKAIRIVVTVLLVLVLVIGAGNLILRGVQARENAQSGQEAQQTANIPNTPLPEPTEPSPPPVDPEPMPDPIPVPDSEPAFDDPYARSLLETDLAELQAVNADVLGWISIPDTPISYPLLQGEDNEYYLNHTWQKEYNVGGSIFMECQNNADFSSFNTIIYGHRMSDSSMFNSLRHYEDEAYFAEHPRIYIVTAEGVRVYEVFASMEVTVTDPVYWLLTTQENYKQKMIDFCLEQSVIDGGIIPDIEDNFLTLSTCTSLTVSDDRWVVIAVEVGMVEHPSAES